MRTAVFNSHRFEQEAFDKANEQFKHELTYIEPRLSLETAKLATGFPAVCVFVNDQLDARVLGQLWAGGVRLIALRSAGFNNVDRVEASRLGFKVVRVPAYSPHAIAEHAVALLMGLNRKLCKASIRVRQLDFSLEGLVGFDLYQKTVGVVGTGKIGAIFAKIMCGFGCEVLLYDVFQNDDLLKAELKYVSLDELYQRSDIISLHVPLMDTTWHLINEDSMKKMKKGVVLINTGRGALIDSKALIDALKSGRIGGAALDVYEEEENIFFQDLSSQVLQDDVLARLLTFPNVMITAHQAFLTHEALGNIAETTLKNISDFEQGLPLINAVPPADT